MNDKGKLTEFPVNVRLRISALWVSVMFCYVYGDYFELYVPKKTQGLVTGENMLDSPGKLFVAALVLAIPAVMIFLSVALKPAAARALNFLLGVLYTVMMLFIALTSLSPWLGFYVFFALLESFLTALIVWHAWKWPRTAG